MIKYKIFLETLIAQDFIFQTFVEFINNCGGKVVVLRHDIDKKPYNALALAKIEHELGIKACYMFRIKGESNEPSVIEEIVRMGHELGYHYEDVNLTIAWKKKKLKKSIEEIENIKFDGAYILFQKNLEYFRQFYPLKVISMHGSPTSKIDNRLIWKQYNYKDFDLICEPYFDIDYSKVFYLTDTGRKWNGDKVSVRDSVIQGNRRNAIGNRESVVCDRETGYGDFQSTYSDQKSGKGGLVTENKFINWMSKPVVGSAMNPTQESLAFQSQFNFRNTDQIIQAAKDGKLPKKIIINTHPQRWTNKVLPWVGELLWQNIKNFGKYFLIKISDLYIIKFFMI